MDYLKVYLKYPTIGLYPIYSDEIYGGREPMKIVGIRENLVELEGDFSGTYNITGTWWYNTDKCFYIIEQCPEQVKEGRCQAHNLFCCGGGKVLNKHSEKAAKYISDNYKL